MVSKRFSTVFYLSYVNKNEHEIMNITLKTYSNVKIKFLSLKKLVEIIFNFAFLLYFLLFLIKPIYQKS